MKKLLLSLVLALFAANALRAQLIKDNERWVQTSSYPVLNSSPTVTPIPAGANISPYVRDGMILIKGYSDRNYLMHIDIRGHYVFGYDLELTDGNKVMGLFSGGAATAYRHGKPVVLTSEGHILTPPDNYRMITDFKDGVAVVLKGDGYTNDVVYIDAAMKEIYPKLTQKNVGYSASKDLKPTGILSENMRAYFDCKLQRWGYMDHHGNPVVEPQFLEALPFREGRAAVLVETEKWGPRLWGFIDVLGKMVIEPIYKVKPTSFSSGYAAVNSDDGFGDTMFLIDRYGQKCSDEAAWANVPAGGCCIFKALPQYRDGEAIRVAIAGGSTSDGTRGVSFKPGIKQLRDYLVFSPPTEDLNGERGLLFVKGFAAVGKYDSYWKTTMGTVITCDGDPTPLTVWQEFKVVSADGTERKVGSAEDRNYFYNYSGQGMSLFNYGIGPKQLQPEMGWVRGFVSPDNLVIIRFEDLPDDQLGKLTSMHIARADIDRQ